MHFQVSDARCEFKIQIRMSDVGGQGRGGGFRLSRPRFRRRVLASHIIRRIIPGLVSISNMWRLTGIVTPRGTEVKLGETLKVESRPVNRVIPKGCAMKLFDLVVVVEGKISPGTGCHVIRKQTRH